MVSKTVLAATVVAAAGANAQLDGIISSIAGQISAGLVAGRRDGVPESQAASEVAQILTVLNGNSDVKNLLSQAGGLVLGGINSSGVVSFASAAQASIAALIGSPDGTTLDALISSHGSDLNGPKAFSIISGNLSPVLNLVVPQISSLSAGDANVASAVNGLLGSASSLVGKYGLLDSAAASSAAPSSSAAASSAAPSSSAAASSAAPSSAAPSSAAPSSAASSSHASSAAPSTSAAPTSARPSTTSAAPSSSSSVPQVNGQGQITVQLAAVGGAAAAAAVLFL